MGTTFDHLSETIHQKWYHLRGELLLHYERFVLMPPPFNTIHIMIYAFSKCFCYQKCFVEKRWRLIGKWNSEQDWKSKQKGKLKREREHMLVGGISKYSTSHYIEVIENEIEEEVENLFEEEKVTLANDLFQKWENDIKKNSESPSQYVHDILEEMKSKYSSPDQVQQQELLSECQNQIMKKENSFTKVGMDSVLSTEERINNTISTIEEKLLSERAVHKEKQNIQKMKMLAIQPTIEHDLETETKPNRKLIEKNYFDEENDSSAVELERLADSSESQNQEETETVYSDDETIDPPTQETETVYSGDETIDPPTQEAHRPRVELPGDEGDENPYFRYPIND